MNLVENKTALNTETTTKIVILNKSVTRTKKTHGKISQCTKKQWHFANKIETKQPIQQCMGVMNKKKLTTCKQTRNGKQIL